MSANLRLFRAGLPAGVARGLYPDAPAQLRLAAIVAINLAAIAICFYLETLLIPRQPRLDATTPGWCFVLAQAGVLGFVVAMSVRAGPTAVVQSLLVATLIGYVYVFAGVLVLDARRLVQLAQLVFRAVELGLVSAVAMALGITLRLVLGQCLSLNQPRKTQDKHTAQYHLDELLFVTVVFGIIMGLLNMFFNHFRREAQLWEVGLSTLRSLPAALPWLWGVMQKRLSWPKLILIVASSVGFMVLKACIEYPVACDDFGVILERSGRRAAAFAAAATLNGLLLRGFGFQWGHD